MQTSTVGKSKLLYTTIANPATIWFVYTDTHVMKPQLAATALNAVKHQVVETVENRWY